MHNIILSILKIFRIERQYFIKYLIYTHLENIKWISRRRKLKNLSLLNLKTPQTIMISKKNMIYRLLKLKGKIDHLPKIIVQTNLDFSRKYQGIIQKIHNSRDIELCRIPLRKTKKCLHSAYTFKTCYNLKFVSNYYINKV